MVDDSRLILETLLKYLACRPAKTSFAVNRVKIMTSLPL